MDGKCVQIIAVRGKCQCFPAFFDLPVFSFFKKNIVNLFCGIFPDLYKFLLLVMETRI